MRQRDAGPAVHGALQSFPTVDLAFDLVIAPGRAGDILDRGQFEPQGVCRPVTATGSAVGGDRIAEEIVAPLRTGA